jgi:hypothetical protein
MKSFNLVFLLLALPSLSCLEDSDDCICTEEFRMITVFVIDESNKPVEGLVTTIKDEQGKVYDLSGYPPFFTGYYTVLTDVQINDFSTIKKKILFNGQSDSLEVNGEFLINTDKCKCHINKVSGPDTLVLK